MRLMFFRHALVALGAINLSGPLHSGLLIALIKSRVEVYEKAGLWPNRCLIFDCLCGFLGFNFCQRSTRLHLERPAACARSQRHVGHDCLLFQIVLLLRNQPIPKTPS
eukprot:SAG31_NODE_10907_length_1085_cov_1.100406_1_plen_108_part_00